MSRRTTGAVSLVALVSSTLVAAAAPFEDRLVQAPTLAAPQRGSLAGSLSRTAFGPGDIARGTFGMPLPIATPDERGPLLAGVAPSYSTEAGLSEWGMGWAADLSIRRFKIGGEIDFAANEFTSPWGRLVVGDDGYYYPSGAPPMMRLSRTAAGGWLVETGDGTTYRFNPTDAVTTPRGTYAWQLSRVDTLVGDSTTLTWTRNTSGRPFLSTVSWGGRGDGTAYRMNLIYEAVPTPWVSVAPGVRHVLDKRVKQIAVTVKNGATYATRWSYTLTYQASPTGPGFYLTSLQRTMASSQREPAVRYDYDLGVEQRAGATFQPIASLDAVLATYGAATILPSQSAALDLEQNGLADLELSYDFTSLRQQAAGWSVEALPPKSDASPLCRPQPSTLNTPRYLARMHGDAIDAQVVTTVPMWLTTLVMVCDRGGTALSSNAAAGDWDLGANRRLADVDGDLRPDLVAAYAGAVDVLPNTASSATQVGFAPAVSTSLTPVVTPDTTWVMDHNGDGRADLMVRTGNDLFVWLGVGQRRFESTATAYPLMLATGTPLTELGSYELSHGDFNGDGLADVVASKNGSATLFTNRGAQYLETAVSALVVLPSGASFPLVADLTASGNEAVVVVANGRAHALDLTAASTGLLRSADDGMGTVLSFGYARTAPWPGAVRRHSTLRSLTVASSGYDTVTYQYEYGAPIWHSVGKFLVGYQSTAKQSPFLTESLTFANDDDVSAVPLDGIDVDQRTPGIVRFAHNTYDDVRLHNVRWLRPSTNQQGLRSPDGAITHAVTTRTLTYARGGCPTTTETVGPSGTLTETTTLASLSLIPDALHCLAATTSVSGTHADSALDFTYLLDAARNDRGQITSLTQRTPGGATLRLQDVTYGTDHRIANVSLPGRGSSGFTYDTLGRLATATDPVGVAQQITAYDPVTDAIRTLRRGAGTAGATFSYRYDGRERLASLWDDQSGTSEADPSTIYAYRDPTSLRPGRIDTTLRADLWLAREKSVELLAADGSSLATGRWMNDADGYAMDDLTIVDRVLAQVRTANLTRMSAGTLSNITSSQLRATGVPLDVDQATGFGEDLTETVTHEATVIGTTSHLRTLTTAGIVERTRHPDGAIAEAVGDAAGQVVRTTDETGATQTYSYDAAGRLVRLETPDGLHAVRFDGFGRVARVDRAGVGALVYAYDPDTGMATRTEQLTSSGAPLQVATKTYDARGRVTRVDLSAGAATSTISFFHDGSRGPLTQPIPGQTGQLTQVQGDGWTKTGIFDLLGRAIEEETTIAGWRSLKTERGYNPNGSIAWEDRSVFNAAGGLLFSSTRTLELDAAGRVSTVSVDGSPLYHLVYDVEGDLAQVGVDATGDLIEFATDPATGERTGYHLETSHGDDGIRWRHNPRGQIASEIYNHNGVDTVRSYQYSPRDQLVATTTGAEATSYAYSESGQPSSVTDGAGTRALKRTGPDLTVGGVAYHWDTAGRVDRKGAWTLSYGASGQVETATRPGRTIQYTYDEDGQRIIKRVDGTPVRADIGGGILTGDRFVEVIAVEGIVIGLLDNGVFTSLLTDPRGTVIVGKSGMRTLASPYGLRTTRPDVTELIDFTKLGWDPDLDVIRMGVRDYDANLAQFHTPDPLFLADPGLCVDSPLECNLYGYAAGNPIAFTDPSGTSVWGRIKSVGRAVGSGAKSIAVGFGKAAVESAKGVAALPGKVYGCASDAGACASKIATTAVALGKAAYHDPLGMAKTMACGTDGCSMEDIGGAIFNIAEGAVTGGASAAAKTAIKTAVGAGVKVATKTAAKAAVRVVAKAQKLLPSGHVPKLLAAGLQVPGRVQSRINLARQSVKHMIDRHWIGGKASTFYDSVSAVKDMVSSRQVVESPVLRALKSGGELVYERRVDMGRVIGFDKFANAPTTILTVLTNREGNLVTAFPGVLK